MGLPDDIIIPSDDGTGNVTPNNQTIVTPAVDDTTGAESNTPNPGDPDELMFPGWANKVPSATKTDQTDNKPSNTSQLKQEKKSEEKKTNNNKKTDKDKGEKDKKEEKKDDPDEGGIKLPKPPTINESPKIASTDTPSTPYQIQPAADPKPVPPTLAQKIQDNKSDNAQQQQNPAGQQAQNPAGQQAQNPAGQQQPQNPTSQQQPQNPASQQQPQNAVNQQQQPPASQQQQQNPANQQQPQTPASQQQPQPPANQQQPQTPASQQQQTPASQQQQQNPASTSSSSGSEKSIRESIVQAGKMIGGGWKDSLTSLAPSWGYDGKGTDSHRFFSTQTDYEGNYNASQKRFKALNMSKLPNKTSNHTALMGMECCTENAIVKCAMGTIFSRLHVIAPSRLGFIGKDGPRNRFATVMDFVPGVNFDGFGACWNLLNPVCLANTIAASIAAGMFVLTPAPCMLTMMPSPWPLVQPPVLYKGVPLLVNTNISICWGLGFIQVVNCGQGQGPGAPGFSDGNGNLDWHAIAATAANVAGALALPFAIGSKIALATNAAKAAQIGAGLKNAAIAANVLSAGITVADGVGYLYQGKYLEAGLSIGLGSLGVKSGVSELGQGARVVNGIKEAAKAGKIPAEVLQKLNGVKGIANNPVAIRKIIQQNPETFGKISKMPTKELDKLIKSSGFSDSVAAFGRKEEALQRITTNTEKLKTMPDPNATITKLQTAQEDLHTAQKILPEVEDTLRQSKAAKEALPEAKLALEESQNAKKALPAAQEALNKATQAEKELPGLERQLANAKAAEGQIENAKTAVGIAKDAAEKLPGEEAALKAMKQDLASLEKELDEMSKSADSLEDLSQIDGVAEKYQEIARLRQAITEKTTHVENLKNTANLLEDAEANLKRVEEEAGKIKEIESQIDNIKAGKKAAEEKFKELSGLAANEDKYQNEVNRLTDLAAKEKGAQAMVDELNDQISNKQHEIAELTGQFHDYNKTSNQITIDNMTVKNDHLKSQTHHEEHYVYTGIDGEEYQIPTDNFPAEIGDGLLKTGAFETGMTGSSMYDWSQENNDGKVKDRNRDLEITPEDLNKYNSDFEEELKQNGLIEPDMDFSKYDFSLLDD